MGIRLLAEGSWDFLERTLTTVLPDSGKESAGAASAPSRAFAEIWIVVPSPGLARQLQRVLAASTGAAHGIRIETFPALIRRILLLGRSDPAPVLDRLARDLLLHRVIIAQLPALERILGSETLRTPAFEAAAIKTLCDLREAGIAPDEVTALARRRRGRAGARLEAVARLHAAAGEAFDRLYVPDPDAALRRAAESVREWTGSETDAAACDRFIVYGFYDLTGSQAELVEALSTALPTTLCVPSYPETEAYAGDLLGAWRESAQRRTAGPPGAETEKRELLPLSALWRLLGSGGEAAPASVTIASHPGRGREVDAALRLLVAAWRGGRRREETTLTAFSPDLYRGAIREQAASAGFGESAGMGAVPAAFLSGLARTAGDDTGNEELLLLLRTAALITGRWPLPPVGSRLLGYWRSAGSLPEWAGRFRDRAERLEPNTPEQARALGATADLIDELIPLTHALTGSLDPSVLIRAVEEVIAPRLVPGHAEGLLAVLESLRGTVALGQEFGPGDLSWVLGRLVSDDGSAAVPLPHVMDLRGCRHPLVVALGLAEGAVPARPGPDPLLLEEDRLELSGPRPWLLPTPRRRLLEEKLLFRLLLESGHHVVLFYPRLDEEGRGRRMSPYLRDLLRERGDNGIGSEGCERLAARDSRTLGHLRLRPGEPVLGPTDRDLAAVGEVLSSEPEEHGGDLPALWSAPTFAAGWRAEMGRWSGGPGPWSGFILAADARRYVRKRLGLEAGGRVSVSLLQEYAACPWKTLAVRVLGIEEPEDDPFGLLDPAELGSVLHAALHGYVSAAQKAGRWPPGPGQDRVDGADMREIVRKQIRRAYRRRGVTAPAFERADLRRAGLRLQAWLGWESRRPSDAGTAAGADVKGAAAGAGSDPPGLDAAAANGWNVYALEEAFTFDLMLRNRTLTLRGRWDRVDRAPDGRLRILDYKTGGERPPAEGDLNGGLQLQMPLYLIAAEEIYGELGPLAGGAFVHLDPRAPRRDPKIVPWPAGLIGPGRGRIADMIDDLLASIEQGVFLRLPHEHGSDSRTGLCTGCPTPSICRAWRIEESARHLRSDLLYPLNRVRRIGGIGAQPPQEEA